ncbi:MAG: hypothetical protein ACFFBV_11975 [Promethearchaeota archaeon]
MSEERTLRRKPHCSSVALFGVFSHPAGVLGILSGKRRVPSTESGLHGSI